MGQRAEISRLRLARSAVVDSDDKDKQRQRRRGRQRPRPRRSPRARHHLNACRSRGDLRPRRPRAPPMAQTALREMQTQEVCGRDRVGW